MLLNAISLIFHCLHSVQNFFARRHPRRAAAHLFHFRPEYTAAGGDGVNEAASFRIAPGTLKVSAVVP
eukprot:3805525-Pyramimonas_sp.AAC.1